ncbi:MAG TPA: DUF86 domain-containing protein [Nitrospirae bacterium]|nr:hypothetical protein BMS3Abin06_02556 [bacterium BMS3Abin06]HDH11572.1 DUF86 domain-containing protein [Nitrospirota bacterium]HDZ01971.1 DUF86 domain-containing protein [Nitrospirota bacterium]
MRDYYLYLEDMVNAMEAIERFVKGIDFDEFQHNDMISSAVIRKFEIIGEAAKNVPETVRSKYPELPWKEMSGMRDRLIHFYFGVKYDLVWHTIKDIIPAAKSGILKILTAGQ